MGKSITIRTSIFLALGGFVNGYDNGIMQWVLDSPSYRAFFHGSSPSRYYHTAGYLLSAFVTFWLADAIGRKKSVFIGACMSVLGSTIQVASTSTFEYNVGLVVSNIANGILILSTQVYIAEIAEVQYRGALIGLVGVLLWWGYFFAQWIGFVCTQLNSNSEWRLPLAIQIFPNLAIAAGVWDLQESPVWLMLKDRKVEAKEELQQLRGNSISLTEDVSGEYEEMNGVIVPEKSTLGSSLKGLYQKPARLNKLLFGCAMQILNEISGEWILVINTFVLLQLRVGDLNFMRDEKLGVGMAFSVTIIYSTIGVYLLQRVDRVRVLFLSALGCSISLLANGALSQYLFAVDQGKLKHNIDVQHWLDEDVILAMILANILLQFFFVIYKKTSGVYLLEVLPAAIRVRGIAIAAVSRTCLELVVYAMTAHLSLVVYRSIGFKILYAFSVLNFAAAWSYFFLYPETKGKTLSQMEELFEGRVVFSVLGDSDANAPLLSAPEEKSFLAIEG